MLTWPPAEGIAELSSARLAAMNKFIKPVNSSP
jgi:hypothetical protein